MIVVQASKAIPGAKGFSVDIDEDRAVHMYPADPSGVELIFVNGETYKRLMLSDEAVSALLDLLAHAAQNPLPPLPDGQ